MEINKEKIEQILSRNVEKVIEARNLEKRLLRGGKLRIKHGIDPTGPQIHLGRAVVLWKLKEFQDLGHKIVLILGDYTAQIGDPSDKLHKRPFLSEKQVKENLRKYQQQIGRILDSKKIEWRKNSEWLSRLSPRQLDELADLFSIQQMVARRNFKVRWNNQEEISLRELHYPLYQGYDSVVIKADVEVGGNDQLFNLLAGRKIQQAYKQKPQDILIVEMLEGLDREKMSTTRGNVININDSSQDQYGKIMSMHDDLIIKYFKLCTLLKKKEVEGMAGQMKKGANPRDFKAKLAYEIVKLYHGEKQAQKAAKEFDRIFKERKTPKNVPIFKTKSEKDKLINFLSKSKLVSSKGEARRLIEQRAVEIDGQIIDDWRYELKPKTGMIIKVGKRRFLKIESN